MLGLSFASVPLYDLFCRVTGYAGTVQRASLAPGSNGQYRNIQIRFDSNISQELNWEFKAPKKEIIVQPPKNWKQEEKSKAEEAKRKAIEVMKKTRQIENKKKSKKNKKYVGTNLKRKILPTHNLSESDSD